MRLIARRRVGIVRRHLDSQAPLEGFSGAHDRLGSFWSFGAESNSDRVCILWDIYTEIPNTGRKSHQP